MVAPLAKRWHLLPLGVVRSTGFPVEILQSQRVAPIDDYERALEELERVTARARQELESVGDGKWRKQAARKLTEGQMLEPPPDGGGREIITRYQEALKARDHMRAVASDKFEGGLYAARQQLIALCRGDELREVLFASSETAFSMAARLIERPITVATNSKQRADEDRIALFVQRLCAKNETASYYGPIFWTRVDDVGARFSSRAGEGSWLSQRDVLVEHWATSALARALTMDPEVAPYLRPQLNPACRLDGDVLHYPVAKQAKVGESMRRVIEAADGRRTQREVRELDPATYDGLVQKRILSVGLPIPTLLRCDEVLHRFVRELPEACAGRARWLERLDELRALAERYRQAGLEGRRQARAAIDARFSDWTQSDPRRGQGRMFVGRNVVHEICGRNAHLDLGPLAKEIEHGLSPVCDLARWIFLEEAAAYERKMLEVLAPELEKGPLDLLQAVQKWRPHEQSTAIEAETQGKLLAAWRAVVGERFVSETRHLELGDETIAEVVKALEPHDDDRLRPDEIVGADFHSPDLLLAASDAEAVARGDYKIVVGELHAGVYSVSSPIYLLSCPWMDTLRAGAERLLADPFLLLVDPPATYNYGDLLWPDVPRLREIVHEGSCSRFGQGRSIPVSNVCLRADGGRLYVDTVDGKIRQRFLSLYQSFLHRKVFALPMLPFEGTRGARVTMGRFVLRRRTWRFTGAERPLVDPTEVRTLDGYAALRRWQRTHELPDRIFTKITGEPKPVLVDFRAPLLCAAWLRLLDAERSFWCSEMMPANEEMWLADERGHFSSEIRLTLTCR